MQPNAGRLLRGGEVDKANVTGEPAAVPPAPLRTALLPRTPHTPAAVVDAVRPHTQTIPHHQHHQQQQQHRSGSDSAAESATTQWLVPSQDASPATAPFVSSSAAIEWDVGVVQLSFVDEAHVQAVLAHCRRHFGVRTTTEVGVNGQSSSRINFAFFQEGEWEGHCFVCFDTVREAQAMVAAYPNGMEVEPRESGLVLRVQLSSMEELARASQNYTAWDTNFYGGESATPAMQEAESAHAAATSVLRLRGVPFDATDADIYAFVRGIPLVRVDVARLSTGEMSGNIFVEVATEREKKMVENLHHKVLPIAAHEEGVAEKRPRPRYVEVLASSPREREETLAEDRRMSRSQLLEINRLATRHRVRDPGHTARATLNPALAPQPEMPQHPPAQPLYQPRTSLARNAAPISPQPLFAALPTSSFAADAPFFLVQGSSRVVGVVSPSRVQPDARLSASPHVFAHADPMAVLRDAPVQYQFQPQRFQQFERPPQQPQYYQYAPQQQDYPRQQNLYPPQQHFQQPQQFFQTQQQQQQQQAPYLPQPYPQQQRRYQPHYQQ